MSKRNKTSSTSLARDYGNSNYFNDAHETMNTSIHLPTSSEISPLLTWLEQKGTIGLDDLEFKHTVTSGLGCYAKKDFDVGDLVFSVPHSCIITFDKVLNSPWIQSLRNTAREHGIEVTAELWVWLFLCNEYEVSASSHFGNYLRSLDRDQLPCLSTWNADLLEALNGTNLGKSVAEIVPSLALKVELLHHLAQHCDGELRTQLERISNIESLRWARSHYLSRRYPARFGGDENIYERELKALPREIGLSNMGSLVPLLDILNHKSEVEWLTFEVTDNALQVICNHPVRKGEELYSNYGSQSNEMFLYAYGFAVMNNEDDAVTVRLTQHVSKEASDVYGTGDTQSSIALSSQASTYYINRGGLEGIPQELWQAIAGERADEEDSSAEEDNDEDTPFEIDIDDCRVLLNHLLVKSEGFESGEAACEHLLQSGVGSTIPKRKRKQQASPIDHRITFLLAYRQGQRKILTETIAALQDAIEGAEDEDDNSQECTESVSSEDELGESL